MLERLKSFLQKGHGEVDTLCMSKDFKIFLQQFSEKMHDAHEKKNFSQVELDQLDETISGLLSVADRVYAEDVRHLVSEYRVEETLDEMRATIELHLCNIGGLSMDHAEQTMKIAYNMKDETVALIEIPDAIQKYFRVPALTLEFDFFTAYLAQTENYDVIQIYQFLRQRLQ